MHTVQFTKGLKRNKETTEGRIWLFLSDCLSRDLNLWLFSKFMVLRISDSDCNLHHHLLWFSGLQTLCTPISFPGAPIYRVEIMGLLSFHNCMSFSYNKFLLICISYWFYFSIGPWLAHEVNNTKMWIYSFSASWGNSKWQII